MDSDGKKTVHQYIDEQGNTLYIEDPYYYEENGNTVVYGQPYEPEVYQEEVVEQDFTPSTSGTQKPPPIQGTVLLTSESLSGQNATFLSKSGPKSKKSAKPTDEMRINRNGSELNRNLPSMKHLFSVVTASAMEKTKEFLKISENLDQEPQNLPETSGQIENEVENEDEDEEEEEDDLPPPMEKLGVLESEIAENPENFENFHQWPLFSNSALDFREACELLIGVQQIDEMKVCKSLPLLFKHEGTFIVDLRLVRDVLNDENGGWEVPSGKTRFYKESSDGNLIRADDGKGRLKSWTKDFTYKILLKKYENRVTKTGADDGRGHFQKKIYTGTKGAEKLPYAIVSYYWSAGRAWNFVPPVPSQKLVKKANWEKKSYEKVDMTQMPQMVSAFYEGFNIFSHCIVSFDEAASIMLGATVVDSNKICSSVPIGYRQNGSFVIDLKRMGHCTLELRRDENGLWTKPSGFSRFYKIAENGDAIRVDKAGKLAENVDFDVKISSKRYEHPQVAKKFVRKIYTAKGKNQEIFPGSPELAVIVYYWKGDPIPFEPAYKQNFVRTDHKNFRHFQQIAENEEEFVETDILEPDLDAPPPLKRAHYEPEEPEDQHQQNELKMAILRREMENQERFSVVLDRAENLLGRMEQQYFQETDWNQQHHF